MFASRYFNPRYWASRYWPKIGAALITSPTVVIIKFDASNNVIKIQESDRDINVINPNRRIIF